jgi:hypothetical protein
MTIIFTQNGEQLPFGVKIILMFLIYLALATVIFFLA